MHKVICELSKVTSDSDSESESESEWEWESQSQSESQSESQSQSQSQSQSDTLSLPHNGVLLTETPETPETKTFRESPDKSEEPCTEDKIEPHNRLSTQSDWKVSVAEFESICNLEKIVESECHSRRMELINLQRDIRKAMLVEELEEVRINSNSKRLVDESVTSLPMVLKGNKGLLLARENSPNNLTAETRPTDGTPNPSEQTLKLDTEVDSTVGQTCVKDAYVPTELYNSICGILSVLKVEYQRATDQLRQLRKQFNEAGTGEGEGEGLVKFRMDVVTDLAATDYKLRIIEHMVLLQRFDEVIQLIQEPKDACVLSRSGWSPVMICAVKQSTDKLVEHLLRLGCGWTFVDIRGYNCMHLAAQHGMLPHIKLIRKYYPHCNLNEQTSISKQNAEELGIELELDGQTNTFGWTSAMLAARHSHLDVLEYLFDNGVDVNFAKEDGVTCMHVSAATGNSEAIKFLVDRGCYLNELTHNGESPLYVAAKFEQIDTFVAILKSPALRMSRDDIYSVWSIINNNISDMTLFRREMIDSGKLLIG